MEYNNKIRRKFNTEGQCFPKYHYMVRLDERMRKMKEQYVEQCSYFIINRSRQYGKTTTLWNLEEYLKEEYLVVSMDFQGITTEEYKSEFTFTTAFMRMFFATVFDLDMSFSIEQIAEMLREYEEDKHTGMDIKKVAAEIYRFTAGYPYLVSAICKILDEKLPYSEKFINGQEIWTGIGISEAVKMLLKSDLPLFGSLVKQLDIYRDLRKVLENILYQGKQIPFSSAEKSINLGCMFGFLKEENGQVVVANQIFEMYLLNLFIAEEALESDFYRHGENDKNQFVKNGKLLSGGTNTGCKTNRCDCGSGCINNSIAFFIYSNRV